MDLDVVRRTDERGTWVDDRDEWDEHRVQYGYPAEIVEHLEATALDLERRVLAREAPFSDEVTGPWLERLASMATPDDRPAARA
jgi:protein associated with RNAse G/E